MPDRHSFLVISALRLTWRRYPSSLSEPAQHLLYHIWLRHEEPCEAFVAFAYGAFCFTPSCFAGGNRYATPPSTCQGSRGYYECSDILHRCYMKQYLVIASHCTSCKAAATIAHRFRRRRQSYRALSRNGRRSRRYYGSAGSMTCREKCGTESSFLRQTFRLHLSYRFTPFSSIFQCRHGQIGAAGYYQAHHR